MQGVVEAAWRRVTRIAERFTFAGRTDASVHAERQVTSVRTECAMTVEHLRDALAAELPADVGLLELVEAEPGFNARASAEWRAYRYVAPRGRYLDLPAMKEAARRLEGEHDFSAFSSVGQLGPRGAVRRLLKLEIEPNGTGVVFHVVADAFLRQMVRRLVSALSLIGTGKITERELVRGLELGDRSVLPGPAPAEHLTLVEVGYGEIN